jgi:hypothetical protein
MKKAALNASAAFSFKLQLPLAGDHQAHDQAVAAAANT